MERGGGGYDCEAGLFVSFFLKDGKGGHGERMRCRRTTAIRER